MTQSAIVSKLGVMLAKGITSEAEALYLMVGVRKLLEQQKLKEQYDYLKFHCDWAVHPSLNRTPAQKILKQFDAANIYLKAGLERHQLPSSLNTEVDNISKMRYFEDQLEEFLNANGLPTLEMTRSDGWIHFVHLYAGMVEDCPLVMTAENAAASISSVTLKMEIAKPSAQDGGDVFFKTQWLIKDRNGLSGEIAVFNSFSRSPALVDQNFPCVKSGSSAS